jgi:hypothetical protein
MSLNSTDIAIFIHRNVPNSRVITKSLIPNAFYYDFEEFSTTNIKEYIDKSVIANKQMYNKSLTRIGIIYNNTFEDNKSIFKNESWSSPGAAMNLFVQYAKSKGINDIDIITCEFNNELDIQGIMTLSTKYGVNISYSTDETSNNNNWIQESNGLVLIGVYFTSDIEFYTEHLGRGSNNSFLTFKDTGTNTTNIMNFPNMHESFASKQELNTVLGIDTLGINIIKMIGPEDYVRRDPNRLFAITDDNKLYAKGVLPGLPGTYDNLSDTGITDVVDAYITEEVMLIKRLINGIPQYHVFGSNTGGVMGLGHTNAVTYDGSSPSMFLLDSGNNDGLTTTISHSDIQDIKLGSEHIVILSTSGELYISSQNNQFTMEGRNWSGTYVPNVFKRSEYYDTVSSSYKNLKDNVGPIKSIFTNGGTLSTIIVLEDDTAFGFGRTNAYSYGFKGTYNSSRISEKIKKTDGTELQIKYAVHGENMGKVSSMSKYYYIGTDNNAYYATNQGCVLCQLKTSTGGTYSLQSGEIITHIMPWSKLTMIVTSLNKIFISGMTTGFEAFGSYYLNSPVFTDITDRLSDQSGNITEVIRANHQSIVLQYSNNGVYNYVHTMPYLRTSPFTGYVLNVATRITLPSDSSSSTIKDIQTRYSNVTIANDANELYIYLYISSLYGSPNGRKLIFNNETIKKFGMMGRQQVCLLTDEGNIYTKNYTYSGNNIMNKLIISSNGINLNTTIKDICLPGNLSNISDPIVFLTEDNKIYGINNTFYFNSHNTSSSYSTSAPAIIIDNETYYLDTDDHSVVPVRLFSGEKKYFVKGSNGSMYGIGEQPSGSLGINSSDNVINTFYKLVGIPDGSEIVDIQSESTSYTRFLLNNGQWHIAGSNNGESSLNVSYSSYLNQFSQILPYGTNRVGIYSNGLSTMTINTYNPTTDEGVAITDYSSFEPAYVDYVITPGATVPEAPCFLEGTQVLTTKGYKNIEMINENDRIMTQNGNVSKCILHSWVCDKMTDDHQPYRISKGKIAENVPRKDLFVSPLHAVMIGKNKWIFPKFYEHADKMCLPKVTYYNIELTDEHALYDAMIVEDVIVETYAPVKGNVAYIKNKDNTYIRVSGKTLEKILKKQRTK